MSIIFFNLILKNLEREVNLLKESLKSWLFTGNLMEKC